jgi:hypothetical protein
MSEQYLFPVMEIDFVVPSQTFSIEYSLISRRAPPVVREFMLKLLHISNFRREEIAQFFGFTTREVDFALDELVTKGDAEYLRDGSVTLSEQAKQYFTFGNDSPAIAMHTEGRNRFTFDLLSFNYLGRSLRSDRPFGALEIDVSAESRSHSEALARTAFQRSFYTIYDRGHIGAKHDGEPIPDLYKISDVRKEKDALWRFERLFSIDVTSGQVVRSGGDGRHESPELIDAVTSAISRCKQSDNSRQVAEVAQALNDDYALSLLKAQGFDFIGAAIRVGQESPDERSPSGPLVGSLHSPKNWARVASLIDRTRKHLSDRKSVEPVDMVWIAPPNPLWGRCARSIESFEAFRDSSLGYGSKKDQTVLRPKLFLPLTGPDDARGIRSARKGFRDFLEIIHGYVPGGAGASVEMVFVPERFAAVVYHISQPANWDITIPFGFITEDKAQVRRVADYINGYLREFVDANHTRDIGALNGLNVSYQR